jgi:hypothetical protein
VAATAVIRGALVVILGGPEVFMAEPAVAIVAVAAAPVGIVVVTVVVAATAVAGTVEVRR